MKALTIWQPYATLIATGAKEHEWRGWRPPAAVPPGTRIAIHAAKTDAHLGLTRRWPFAGLLERAADAGQIDEPATLPLGAFVASAVLAEVIPSEAREWSDVEAALGAPGPGRYAWRLEGVRALNVPVPFRGAQGLWTVPSELVAQLVLPLAGRS